MVNIKQNKGFTLVEVLIATGILSMFIVAVFNFYNMGSKMFSSGSWKQNTQKKAEVFLNELKDKISKTSAPIYIKTDGKISSDVTSNLGFTKETITSATGKPVRLMCFPTCASALKNRAGVLMYNILRAVSSSSGRNVFDVELISTTNIDSGKGQEFFNGSDFTWFNGNIEVSKFTGNPLNFGLGANNRIITLKDVSSLTITNTNTSGSVKQGNTIHIDITFTQPNNPKSQMKLSTSALLDQGVTVKDSLK